MDLESMLKTYVGGQAEIQNAVEEYIYRGQISDISIKDNELHLRFDWLARGVGNPPTRWVNDRKRNYDADLGIYFGKEIGEGRYYLESPITNELLVLYPKGGSSLGKPKAQADEVATIRSVLGDLHPHINDGLGAIRSLIEQMHPKA